MMSGVIRNENELLTVRIRLMPGRSESFVAFDFYRGREEINDSLRIPAEAFGIPRSMTISEVDSNLGALFPHHLGGGADAYGELGRVVGGLAADRSPGEPLWLQVSHGSTYLATVPWETVLRGLVDPPLPIFRIPNFLIDPHFLVEELQVAVCASSPSAKISYRSAYVMADLVEAFADVAPMVRLHLFTDAAVYDEVNGLAREDGALTVTVHDPGGAEEFGVGGTALRDGRADIASPWLLWMEKELSHQRTDLVHFVSPGYFTSDLGGLALAHSPLGDIDRRKAHMVSPAEINSFLNLVGAWAVGCTIPVPDPWSVGVRIFAEQLARHRPEPIVLHELDSPEVDPEGPDPNRARFQGFHDAYRFLFGPPIDDAVVTPGVAVYAHPKRLGVFADEPATPISSVTQSDFSFGLEMVGSDQAPILRKGGRSDTRPRDESRWQATVRLDVEQSYSKLASQGIETPEEQGEAQALEFLKRALESTETTE
jgi:hypothetical protein